jgi:hypothetical protein
MIVRKSVDPSQPVIKMTRWEKRVLDIGVPTWFTEALKAIARPGSAIARQANRP